MTQKSKTYFISDLHLGTPDAASSKARELAFCHWMEQVSLDAKAIYIIGDLFDFWHEYKTVVPKGFVRAQAAIAKATDNGINVFLFTGNHDLWQRDYFKHELGVELFFSPVFHKIDGKICMIGHGDGLGPDDIGYKRMKKIFTNPICQFLFRWIHPDIGMQLANYFSYKSRYAGGEAPKEYFLGAEKEWLIQYCERKLIQKPTIDYFVFGHRHLPIYHLLTNKKVYVNTGDWLSHYSYAVIDEGELKLCYYDKA